MLKILWISMIVLGFGLIATGAIGMLYNKGMAPLVYAGVGCMSVGLLARRRLFKGK